MERKVMIFTHVQEPGTREYTKVLDGTGEFIQYGVDYEECGEGPGNYSTAIVEMEDGTVKNVPVEMIKFIK